MFFPVVVFTVYVIAVLHKLVSSRQLHGSLHGHGDKAIYIPDIFIRMQNKWSDSFLSSNGYLGRRMNYIDAIQMYCDTVKIDSNLVL